MVVSYIEGSPLFPEAFRRAMSHLASGVTIVTTSLNGSPVGMTATAVCSVSAKPPLLLISLTSGTRTASGVLESGTFVVHLLAQGGQQFAEQFAAPGDHFECVSYHCHEPSGAPVLEDVLGFFFCSVERSLEVADHILFVGRVLECEVKARGHDPLVYFDRAYRKVVPVLDAAVASLEPWGPPQDLGLPGWGLPV
jgi:4-nitrophenol 2-monooxygenase / 4-nitrocatechol 4-monooxygenase, reductase component